jgi:hypothetical protein
MEGAYGYTNTIAKAASRARGVRLGKLYQLCEQQKTVSTRKLSQMLDDLAESDRLDAIHFKELAKHIAP